MENWTEAGRQPPQGGGKAEVGKLSLPGNGGALELVV